MTKICACFLWGRSVRPGITLHLSAAHLFVKSLENIAEVGVCMELYQVLILQQIISSKLEMNISSSDWGVLQLCKITWERMELRPEMCYHRMLVCAARMLSV